VRIHFSRSGYDFADEPSLPVTGYYVWRLGDPPAPLPTGEPPRVTCGDSSLPWPLPDADIARFGDRVFARSSSSSTDRADTFPPGNWEVVAAVPAIQTDSYTVNVPTLAGTNTFLLTTHTTTPSEWFVSPAATGEAIDNLAPGVPTNLLFGGPDTLVWDEAPEPDFAYHTVYGSEDPVFDPSATLLGYTIGQTYDVSGSAYSQYHLTTSDHADNESGAATVAAPASATLAATFTCLPSSGTVPFATQMSVTLDNLYTGQTRRLAGRINIILANGQSITNWRGGYTNVSAGSQYAVNWSQTIPAVGSVVGDNDFFLEAEDVTPAPYNQPPYPPAGDTATAACSITGAAP
jgi:hypothetical protein